METISVDIQLLRQYTLGETPQEVKARKELFAFGLWVKMHYSSSVLLPRSLHQLKGDLGVGYAKASRLMNDARADYRLFSFDKDGRMTVRTFKNLCVKWNRKHKEYRGSLVVKLQVRKDYTLKDLYILINKVLFTFVICGAEADNLHCWGKGNENPSSLCGRTYLTTKKFMKVVGMGRGSIGRIKKTLIAEEKITSDYAQVYHADDRNKEQFYSILQMTGSMKYTFNVGHTHYLVIPCSYSIKDRSVSDSFMHKIYGYRSKVGKQRAVASQNGSGNVTMKEALSNNLCVIGSPLW